MYIIVFRVHIHIHIHTQLIITSIGNEECKWSEGWWTL